VSLDLWKCLKDMVCENNLCTILELETAIQSEIEAMSSGILTKLLNNFVLTLFKIQDIQGHHVEHVLG
jgi:hypothetical protein